MERLRSWTPCQRHRVIEKYALLYKVEDLHEGLLNAVLCRQPRPEHFLSHAFCAIEEAVESDLEIPADFNSGIEAEISLESDGSDASSGASSTEAC